MVKAYTGRIFLYTRSDFLGNLNECCLWTVFVTLHFIHVQLLHLGTVVVYMMLVESLCRLNTASYLFFNPHLQGVNYTT